MRGKSQLLLVCLYFYNFLLFHTFLVYYCISIFKLQLVWECSGDIRKALDICKLAIERMQRQKVKADNVRKQAAEAEAAAHNDENKPVAG